MNTRRRITPNTVPRPTVSWSPLEVTEEEFVSEFLQRQADAGVSRKRKAASTNYCTVCFVDMGACNPRQLCRKTYCENADFVFDFDEP